MEYEGIQNIYSSRSATREAFNKKIIEDGEIWIKMIETRNAIIHNYDEEIINLEFEKIINEYYPVIKDLCQKLLLWL